MKHPYIKWSYIKWIIIGILLIGLLYLYYTFTMKEGFTTISNIQYPFKEIFLVSPTEKSEKGNPIGTYSVPNDTQYKTQGYTWTEARNICRNYGGDLATEGQVQFAYDNSGNWCPAGWTLDSQTTAYYLPTKVNLCGLLPTSITSTIKNIPAKIDENGDRRAFAMCYAPKPPNPSVSVNPFSFFEYSIISGQILSSLMNGDGSDIFPASFTPSQAYYALEQSNKVNNRFDRNNARRFLIDNYETIDDKILSTLKYTDNSNWSTLAQVSQQSCGLLKEKDDMVSTQVLTMQNAFKDISGYVLATVKSKDENSKIQGMLINICKNTTPEQSPACAKLATLDFDLFYTNPTHNTLADLEELNIQIYTRREEVCQILHNIRIVKNILNCNYTPLVPECSEGCNPASPTFDCANTDIFDVNNVGGLKYNLEELSPLFDVPAYSTLLKSVMDKLSYIVETPSLASIDPSKNINLIRTVLGQITDLFNLNSV
jgi:hypothetical protein